MKGEGEWAEKKCIKSSKRVESLFLASCQMAFVWFRIERATEGKKVQLNRLEIFFWKLWFFYCLFKFAFGPTNTHTEREGDRGKKCTEFTLKPCYAMALYCSFNRSCIRSFGAQLLELAVLLYFMFDCLLACFCELCGRPDLKQCIPF